LVILGCSEVIVYGGTSALVKYLENENNGLD